MASGQINDNQDILMFEVIVISGELKVNQDVLMFEVPAKPSQNVQPTIFITT